MSIPIIAGPIGYDSWYVRLYRELLQLLGSPEKFELGWVAPEKKLVIHTDRVDDNTLTEVAAIAATLVPVEVDIVQYNHNMEISWKDINKYAACTTIAEMAAVNPDYKNDLTSDGEWVYPLPELVQAGRYVPDYAIKKALFEEASNLRKLKLNLPKATSIGWLCLGCTSLKEIDIEAPAINNGNYQACAHIIQSGAIPQKMRFVLPKQRFLDQLLFSAAPSAPQHLELYAPKMESAWYAFIEASLDKPSAMGIFNQLQTFTSGNHPLGIGIHVDHKNDEEILAAIENARTNKGWTVDVQWHGTPTSSS